MGGVGKSGRLVATAGCTGGTPGRTAEAAGTGCVCGAGRARFGSFLSSRVVVPAGPVTVTSCGAILSRCQSFTVSPSERTSIAGLILLAAAPCTAMVFVWSNLTDGEPNFTLTQVALNDTIMVFAFAPIVGLLLGLSSITVPWETLFLSVVLYIVVPVIAAQVWRRSLLTRGGEVALIGTLRRLQPVSLVALLATLVLLFGFQGEQIVRQPLVIALLAVPIIIQVYLNAGIAYWLNRALGVPHNVACPSALIGASNFFELAVAAAIALFGFQSGAALATVVGVLVEVPVMLSVVRIVLRTRGWYQVG